MTTWRRVQGDVDRTLTVTLGQIADLSAVSTIEAHVWRGSTYETLTAVVLDADDCTVTVDLGDDDGWLSDAAPGTWALEVEATFADGSVATWPEEKPDKIIVRAQGDGA